MISLAALFALSAIMGGQTPPHDQDAIVVTSGRDVPALNQLVTTAGECGTDQVSVAVSNRRETVEVAIGDRRRDVTADIFPLGTANRERYVARTYLACRAADDGGLLISFLFANNWNPDVDWTIRSFSLNRDLKIVGVYDERPPENALAFSFR